jgi:hypothetical protein
VIFDRALTTEHPSNFVTLVIEGMWLQSFSNLFPGMRVVVDNILVLLFVEIKLYVSSAFPMMATLKSAALYTTAVK